VINRRDRYHQWAVAQWEQSRGPLLTCEAVLTEACFLLNRTAGQGKAVMDLVVRGSVAVALDVADNARPIARLLKKHADVPMSLADACLVRMAELHDESIVLTLDSDFRIYRKNRRQVIPTLMPPGS